MRRVRFSPTHLNAQSFNRVFRALGCPLVQGNRSFALSAPTHETLPSRGFNVLEGGKVNTNDTTRVLQPKHTTVELPGATTLNACNSSRPTPTIPDANGYVSTRSQFDNSNPPSSNLRTRRRAFLKPPFPTPETKGLNPSPLQSVPPLKQFSSASAVKSLFFFLISYTPIIDMGR